VFGGVSGAFVMCGEPNRVAVSAQCGCTGAGNVTTFKGRRVVQCVIVVVKFDVGYHLLQPHPNTHQQPI
jgi:hypothetical protein